MGYCEATVCRRKVILDYFGETLVSSSSSGVTRTRCCDVCDNPDAVERHVNSLTASKAFAYVFRVTR